MGGDGIKRARRGLPYMATVYGNNQVYIPSSLIKTLGLANFDYAMVIMEHGGREVTLSVKLLRAKRTAARLFTLPKSVREALGIKQGDVVIIKSITPLELKPVRQRRY